MKCINDKCENGLWSDKGCLFPDGTICSSFIPESKLSSYMSSRPSGYVKWTHEMKTKLYLLVNEENWKGWSYVAYVMKRTFGKHVSASACRSAWIRHWDTNATGE